MKLKGLGDLLIFDAFPLLYEPKQKIILTHLLHLNEQIFPKQLPVIFTTQKLADQLQIFCEINNHKCLTKNNIIIIKPYEFIDIILERRLTLQILFCVSEEHESNNVMVLIKENGKLNYIYAGNFVDIRSALLNDTFASWISHGVEKLYVNLKRTEENHLFNDIDQMQKVFNKIEDIIKCHYNSKIFIFLPLIGYENFILKLAQRFPKRIKSSNLNKFYVDLPDDHPQIAQHFCEDNLIDNKITLREGKIGAFQAKIKFTNSKKVSINILYDATKCTDYEISEKNGYYELFYSPEPSPFHLKVLCLLVKPQRVFGIVDTFNNKSIVPKYLTELCVGAKERLIKRQEKKLSDSFRASGTVKPAKPTKIITGAFSINTNRKNGPFLSDSETDDEA